MDLRLHLFRCVVCVCARTCVRACLFVRACVRVSERASECSRNFLHLSSPPPLIPQVHTGTARKPQSRPRERGREREREREMGREGGGDRETETDRRGV